MTHPESGKRAESRPIIDRIRDELEALGYDPDVASRKNLNWDLPEDRELVREAFGDGGADEAILPGFGPDGEANNARENCGKAHPFICDSCGQHVDFGRTCAMSVCARCAAAWVRNRGIAKSAKLRRLRLRKEYAIDHLDQKRHHLALMPPLDWFYDLARAGLDRGEALEVTRSIVKSILSEFRAQGVLVRHSYTGKDDDGHIATEDDDLGKWKDRLFERRRWYDDVRTGLAWKPHFHAVVISDWIKGGDLTTEVYESTGWVIRRITGHGEEGYSLEDDGDVARALTYTISHGDIEVDPEGPNQSAIWEVGAFQGEPIKSFKPRPQDYDWADGVIRRIAFTILGIQSGTTDCGKNIPPVDDPDELARRILEELYSDDPKARSSVSTDIVLAHVSEGNIDVDVETSEGGGGNVTVTKAFGFPTAGRISIPKDPSSIELPRKRGSTDLPNDSEKWDVPPGSRAAEVIEQLDSQDDRAVDRYDDEGQEANGEECQGTLIPLDEARRRGLLEDDGWLESARFADEALAADREYLELDPWRSTSSTASIGIG